MDKTSKFIFGSIALGLLLNFGLGFYNTIINPPSALAGLREKEEPVQVIIVDGQTNGARVKGGLLLVRDVDVKE